MKRMDITAPINSADDVLPLIKAGANELYLGYMPRSWHKKYSFLASVNRRYFQESSFTDPDNLKIAIRTAKEHSIPVNMTLNSSYYEKKQYPKIISMISEVQKYGLDGVIIADIPLLLKVRKKFPDLKIVVSTVASSFNSSSADFYASLGASKIVLPRHLTFEEIKEIRKKVRVALETFVFFDWCIYDDGLCTYHHGMEKMLGVSQGCLFVKNYKLNPQLSPAVCNEVTERRINGRFRELRFEDGFCAGCYVKKFQQIGIDSVKLAGRRLPTSVKVQAVNFIRRSFKEKSCEELFFKTFQRRHPLNANAYG